MSVSWRRKRRTADEWRKRFTDDEWALIRHVPVDAYLVVATAEGSLDSTAGRTFIGLPELIKNPLHRALAEEITVADSLTNELEFQMQEIGVVSGAERMRTPATAIRLKATKAILKEKLTSADYQGFLASVGVSMYLLATSSGPAHGGSPENISSAKEKALTAFVEFYEIDPLAIHAEQPRWL
jgi:hypothetical protein